MRHAGLTCGNADDLARRATLVTGPGPRGRPGGRNEGSEASRVPTPTPPEEPDNASLRDASLWASRERDSPTSFALACVTLLIVCVIVLLLAHHTLTE